MKNFFSNKLNVVLTFVLIVILGACTALAFTLFGNPFSHEIIAQNFEGMSKAEVEKWVSDNDLNDIYNFTYQYDDKVEKDKVVYQSVKADSPIKNSLTIIYSKGKEQLPTTPELPKEDDKTSQGKEDDESLIEKLPSTPNKEATIPDNLLGISESEFKKKLNSLGFSILNKVNTTYFAEGIEKGNIYSYDDGTFSTVKTINYTLSEGKYVFNSAEYNDKKVADVEKLVSAYNNRNAKINGKQLTVSFTTGEQNEAKSGKTYDCSISANKISCKTYAGSNNKVTIPTNGQYLGKSEETLLNDLKKLGFTKFKKSDTTFFSSLPENTIYSYDDGNIDLNSEINYALSAGSYKFNASDFNNASKEDVNSKVEALKKRNAKIDGKLISASFADGAVGTNNVGKVYDCNLSGSTIKCSVYTGSDSNTSANKKATIPGTYLKLSESDFLSKVKALGFTNFAKADTTYFSETINEGCIWEYDDGTFDISKTINYRLSAGKYSFNASEFNGISKEDATNKANAYKNRNADQGKLSISFTNGEANASSEGKTYDCSYSYKSISCKVYTGSSAPSVVKIGVSNFVGKSGDEFKTWCSNNGLNYNVSEQYSDTVASGIVISQSPSSGEVSKGSTINAVISKGKEPARNADLLSLSFITQNYKGDTLDETKNKVVGYLNSSGFNNVSVEETTSTKPLYSIVSITVNGDAHSGANSYPVDSAIVVTIVSKNP